MPYLFSHFTGEHKLGEQVYFSVSKDGLHFTDINDGYPVLVSSIGEEGLRDPFLIRDDQQGRFFLIATDLRIEKGLGWSHAVKEGSKHIVIYESKDLVHWSDPWMIQPAPEGAGNLWAPEAIYDEEKGKFLLFWASSIEQKHSIYAAYTADFKEFEPTFKFIEKEMDVIDTTIFRGEDGFYYRFTKNEENSRILFDRSRTLTGDYEVIESEYLLELDGVEGPQMYRLPGGDFAFIVDHFKENTGYNIAKISDLASGKFTELAAPDFDLGVNQKRHGGVIWISVEEYDRLCLYYGKNQPIREELLADPDIIKVDDKFYLYPTTDGFTGWSGSTFQVLESTDLQEFTPCGQIVDLATDQVPWATGNAWAPCCVEKNGKFYYYFTGHHQSGKPAIGVAVSDTPTGPFHSTKEPIISDEAIREQGVPMSQVIDPSIYQEGEEAYLVFGNGSVAAIVRLTPEMTAVDWDTLHVYSELTAFREALTITKHAGRYHFTWSCDDTGSENYHVNYGVADTLYGPVENKGTILEKNPMKEILGTGHHCIFKDGEQFYIAYHSFALPLEKYPENEKGYNRQIRLSPLSFDEQGYMEKVIV